MVEVGSDNPLKNNRKPHPVRALVFFAALVFVLAVIAHRAFWRMSQYSFPAQVVGTEFEVSARAGGIVRRIHVEPNQHVRKGEPLIELYDETAQAEISAASQDLDKIQEALITAKSESAFLLQRFDFREKIAEASAELESLIFEIETNLREIDSASRSLEIVEDQILRAEKLYSQKAITLAELEGRLLSQLEQEVAIQSAKAGLEHKRRRKETLSDRLLLLNRQEANLLSETDKNVTDLELALRKKEGELKTLLARQNERTVRAERDGIVAQITKSVGELVSEGEPLVRISTGERMWVETYLNSEKVNQIREGDRVYVQVETSSSRQRYPGVVKGVLPIMQAQPGYRPGPFEESTERVGVALVEFDDPVQAKRDLRPGQRVTTVLISHSEAGTNLAHKSP